MTKIDLAKAIVDALYPEPESDSLRKRLHATRLVRQPKASLLEQYERAEKVHKQRAEKRPASVSCIKDRTTCRCLTCTQKLIDRIKNVEPTVTVNALGTLKLLRAHLNERCDKVEERRRVQSMKLDKERMTGIALGLGSAIQAIDELIEGMGS